MSSDTPENARWPSYLGIAIIVAVAVIVGLAAAALLGVADALPRDIVVALRQTERASHGRLDLIHIDRPLTGVAMGIRLGLLCLLFGGIPAAILATALAARSRGIEGRWSGGWTNVFLAGFVFQLSSLAFTALLLFAVIVTTADAAAGFQAIFLSCGPLFLSMTFGIWGLCSWRTLQSSVHVGRRGLHAHGPTQYRSTLAP